MQQIKKQYVIFLRFAIVRRLQTCSSFFMCKPIFLIDFFS